VELVMRALRALSLGAVMLAGCASDAPPAMAATAQSPAWKTVGTWMVHVDRSLGGCFVMKGFDGGIGIRVGLWPLGRTWYLMLENPDWARDVAADYPLEISFDGYRSWDGIASPMPSQGPGIVAMRIDDEWLADFAVGHVMTVRHQGRVVAQLSLSGTYAAVNEMLDCQEAINESRVVHKPVGQEA